MKLQLIRNATMKITYAGHTLLTDPMLSPKGAFDGFAGIARNPTVELPFPVEAILDGIAAVVVSHTHADHLDPAAIAAIPKEAPLFCQPGDQAKMIENGFHAVTPVEGSLTWEGLTLSRTGGAHGKGEILKRMGDVSGFVFQGKDEPTVYWVGDSIWCDTVQTAIETHSPDIIITHSGGATLPGHAPIIMDVEQTLAMAQAAPDAIVVAIHMEALDHCGVGRQDLRRMADDAGISQSRLMIPADGEALRF
jgi:L-ascorbate metabolism protein UlaG (beta-lactamase superfamily)